MLGLLRRAKAAETFKSSKDARLLMQHCENANSATAPKSGLHTPSLRRCHRGQRLQNQGPLRCVCATLCLLLLNHEHIPDQSPRLVQPPPQFGEEIPTIRQNNSAKSAKFGRRIGGGGGLLVCDSLRKPTVCHCPDVVVNWHWWGVEPTPLSSFNRCVKGSRRGGGGRGGR